MSFYKVRHMSDQKEYPCGQQRDQEAAIKYFNTQYGNDVAIALTTEPVGPVCQDYLLIEQERRGGGFGLHETGRIPLHMKR